MRCNSILFYLYYLLTTNFVMGARANSDRGTYKRILQLGKVTEKTRALPVSLRDSVSNMVCEERKRSFIKVLAEY